MKYPKRLIEVDLPIKRISGHARREKSIRHGHISTLHIWWARRPLAACRAVICASLWPDPADELCPQAFRDAAAEVMLDFCKAAATSKEVEEICSVESWSKYCTLAKPANKIDPANPDHQQALRYLLLDFIADGAAWEASTNTVFLNTARKLTQAAHEALGGAPGTRPLVVDPFAGGGAIPLEALRMGADAFASDLNPVAVLLNKVVLEYIPKYGKRLADEVRKWGQWVKEQAEKELAQYYPKDPDGSTPIAYLWARTITCEGPGCGAAIPLMRNLWLRKKKGNGVALRLVSRPRAKRIDFEIIKDPKATEVGDGTVAQGRATCPVCGYTTPVSSVRSQLLDRQGGAQDARLLAVVTVRTSEPGRFYRLPVKRDLLAIEAAQQELARRQSQHDGEMSLVPDESFPPTGLRRVQVPNYGLTTIGTLFSPRQALSLVTLSRLCSTAPIDGDEGLSKAVRTVLGLIFDKQVDLANFLNRWEPVAQCPRQLFARQSVPIVWDFAEGVPIGASSGSWHVLLRSEHKVIEAHSEQWPVGHIEMASALSHPLPDDCVHLLATDPPYYDSVVYAHTADVFYPWLRRMLQGDHPELFASELTPKADEVVVDPPHSKSPSKKDAAFFEAKMCEALAEGRRIAQPTALGVIVFAHQSTAGWEAMLQAVLDAGWVVTASWPVDTEMASRVIAQGRAVLASSVHIACRPRENEDGSVRTDDVGDWREVLQELPVRIHEWMPRLAEEGVVGADAIFACLGPALEIFSRYSRVEKASGEEVKLREYLEHVWAAVSQEALQMVFREADASGFEEDARLTAMWLWTLGAGGNGDGEKDDGKTVASTGYGLEYDAARKIAQGLGGHLEQLTATVEVKGDKARLLAVSERAAHLFGKDEVKATDKGKKKSKKQMSFADIIDGGDEDEGWASAIEAGDTSQAKIGETVLDRVHQAMLLFAAGRSEAVRRFLTEEGVGRDSRFWTLAQALSALYPSNSEEKRWVDGVLARKKSLGF